VHREHGEISESRKAAVLFSGKKHFTITGWKIGYCVALKELDDGIQKGAISFIVSV